MISSPACIEQDLFSPSAPKARDAADNRVAFVGFLPAVFMTRFATKPVTCETSKQNVGHVPTMVLSGTRGPLLFRVIREGLGSGVRLGARGTSASNFSVETRSRTRVSQVPGKPPPGLNPRDGTELWEHSSCLWFQISGVEAYSFLPDDQGDRGDFACQGQPRHLRLYSFADQSSVKLLQRPRLGSGDCSRHS